MSTDTAAVVLAVLGLAASAVSAGVAVVALRRSSRHAERIEQLEMETLAHAAGYLLRVAPSVPDTWKLDPSRQQVEELVAHVTNHGAVDTPPVTVQVYVDAHLFGESDARQVGGKRTVSFVVRRDPHSEAPVPRPYGEGSVEIFVSNVHARFMLAFWAPSDWGGWPDVSG
jgi:hypothetical protein